MVLDKCVKIATGVDSEVYLGQRGVVYKEYNHNYSPEILRWYAELTQRMFKLGTCSLGQIESNDGQIFRVTCAVNPHDLIPSESHERLMQTAYIPGPTLISFYAEDYSVPNSGVESYIDAIPDVTERERLTKLNELVRRGDREFLETIYGAYSFELVDWIQNNLSEPESDYYTLPGEMNVKVRMPEDGVIHFVVTDIYGNMLRNYNLCHQEEEI